MQRPILILNFGSQFTQLIARRVRQAQVFSQVLSCEASLAEIQAVNPVGIILSGGPADVEGADAPQADPGIFSLGVPVLGICYGMQLMAATLGGRVEKAQKGEYGLAQVTLDTESHLFAGLKQDSNSWMSHRNQVTMLPAGFTAVGALGLSGLGRLGCLGRFRGWRSPVGSLAGLGGHDRRQGLAVGSVGRGLLLR